MTDRIEAIRARHHIEWEFDTDGVNARAVCTEPEGADCRIHCVHGCESWSIERDQDGTPYHRTGHLEDDGTEIRHDMQRVAYCNVTEFLNDDAGLLPELGSGQFVIGQTPIEPVWENDYYSWKQAPVAPDGEQRAKDLFLAAALEDGPPNDLPTEDDVEPTEWEWSPDDVVQHDGHVWARTTDGTYPWRSTRGSDQRDQDITELVTKHGGRVLVCKARGIGVGGAPC